MNISIFIILFHFNKHHNFNNLSNFLSRIEKYANCSYTQSTYIESQFGLRSSHRLPQDHWSKEAMSQLTN